MDKHLETLSRLMTETFNEVLKIEEQSIKKASGDKVTVTEVHTLDAIGTGAPRTISELAAAMRVTVSTMTISVNRLERKGLVERERAKEDRRVVRVRLTDRGRSIVAAHRRYHHRLAVSVTETLDAGEVDALCRAMDNLEKFFLCEAESIMKSGA